MIVPPECTIFVQDDKVDWKGLADGKPLQRGILSGGECGAAKMPIGGLFISMTDAEDSVLGKSFAHDLQSNGEILIIKAAGNI